MGEAAGVHRPTAGDEAAFLRGMFVYGGEYYMGLPGSVRRDDRYEVQSSHLAARYNARRAERGRDPVSNKSFAMKTRRVRRAVRNRAREDVPVHKPRLRRASAPRGDARKRALL